MRELFCSIGNVVEFVRDVKETSSVSRRSVDAICHGARYRVTGLVGNGWDLERLSGSGPTTIRVSNADMDKLMKVVE